MMREAPKKPRRASPTGLSKRPSPASPQTSRARNKMPKRERRARFHRGRPVSNAISCSLGYRGSMQGFHNLRTVLATVRRRGFNRETGSAFQPRRAAIKLTVWCSSSLPRLVQDHGVIAPRLSRFGGTSFIRAIPLPSPVVAISNSSLKAGLQGNRLLFGLLAVAIRRFFGNSLGVTVVVEIELQACPTLESLRAAGNVADRSVHD